METVTADKRNEFTDSAHNAFLTGEPNRTVPLSACRPIHPAPRGHIHKRAQSQPLQTETKGKAQGMTLAHLKTSSGRVTTTVY